jgi:coenzyme F420-0:L-glutamate ligase/coenzyme F420-1:gamma-L-glutamate ligase
VPAISSIESQHAAILLPLPPDDPSIVGPNPTDFEPVTAATLPPDLEAFIRDARVGRFATVDEHGRPHIIPVCFAYQDGFIYSVLDAKPKRVPVRQLRRLRNLLANPNVQLLVDRYDEDWSRLRYVQLRGHAGLLESGPEHESAILLLRHKYDQYQAMPIANAPVIRLQVDSFRAWNAT